MDIEIKTDKKYEQTKVIIYTNEMNDNVSKIVEKLSEASESKIVGYKEDKVYIIKQNEIENFYAESGKVIFTANNEKYIINKKLYELEEILDKKTFVRISKSEIVNFDKVRNIDFKILGTLVLNFKSGNISYVSRRFVPKIKEFLNI